MCGIAGLWFGRQTGGDERACLQKMLTRLAHRGPDDSGVWEDPKQGILLGQRRLSILDLSPCGHQPMTANDGELVITFNGEIYNFKELRTELEALGTQFRSQTDTEVILHGYRQWGTAVLDRLVGMFAFGIWDAKQRQLFLARDRFGEKPLYYADTSQGFAFASEIAALSEVAWIDRTLDRTAIALYLHFQYIPEPQTSALGIRKLPPGHAMLLQGGSHKIWRYWDPAAFADLPKMDITPQDAVAKCEDLLGRAVTSQMVADVPLGAFLSGGIDSTAIVSLMRKHSSARLKTFTIAFDAPENNEAPYAAAVAKRLDTEHHEQRFTEKELLELVPKLSAIYGEPFGDPSALPTYLVAGVARQHVTVALSGDGGDEIFGGYTRYNRFVRDWSFLRAAGAAGPVLRPLLRHLPGKAGKAGALVGSPMSAVYEEMMSIFSSRAMAEMSGITLGSPEMVRVADRHPRLDPRRYAMLADALTYLPGCILAKVDRAAMRVSLETRAPFLDHRLFEFAARLPADCINNKRVLKEVAYRHVSKELLDRPKKGFGLPLRRWFRGPLADLFRDSVTPNVLADLGFENTRQVSQLLPEHLTGNHNHSTKLWSLLVLSLWWRSEKVPGFHFDKM